MKYLLHAVPVAAAVIAVFVGVLAAGQRTASAAALGQISFRETATTTSDAVSLASNDAAANNVVGVLVTDSDLAGAGTITVAITSDSDATGFVMTLTETSAGSPSFVGTLTISATSTLATPPTIGARHLERVTATYTDLDSGFGTLNIPVSLTVDAQAPAISSLSPADGSSTDQVVTFSGKVSDAEAAVAASDHLSIMVDGTDFGDFADFTSLSGQFSFTVTLFLSAGDHAWQVTARDAAGNPATSDATLGTPGAQAHSLTAVGDVEVTPISPVPTLFNLTVDGAGDPSGVSNDPAASNTVTVRADQEPGATLTPLVRNPTRDVSFSLALTETAAPGAAEGTVQYTGSFDVVQVAEEDPPAGDLGATHGDTIQVIVAPLFNSLTVDTVGPVLSNLMPSDGTITNAETLVFSVEVRDEDSGVDETVGGGALTSIFFLINQTEDSTTTASIVPIFDISDITEGGTKVGVKVSRNFNFVGEVWVSAKAKDNAGNESIFDADETADGIQMAKVIIDRDAPTLRDAFTGVWYDSVGKELRFNDPKKIIVLFDTGLTNLDPASVEASDFAVGSHDVVKAEVFDSDPATSIVAELETVNIRSSVFLTLQNELGADETPQVAIIGDGVKDKAGNTQVSGQVSASDAIAPPVIAAEPAVSVAEGDAGETAVADVLVTLSVRHTHPVSVQYDTSDGDATVGDGDYERASGATLVIPAGNATGTIQITVHGDDIYEVHETFTVTLTTSTDATISPTAASTTVTIMDDDAAPVLSIADVTVAEGASTSTAEVVVTLTGKTQLGASVSFTTSDTGAAAAAKADVDYQSTSGVMNFAAFTTTAVAAKAIHVNILEDEVDEFDEGFLVQLFGAADASVVDGEAAVTIADNDPAPTLSITVIDDTMSEFGFEGTGSRVDVVLTGASSAGVSVDVDLSGTATVGVDYKTTTLSLLWDPDESGAKSYDLHVKDDAIEEDFETIVLTLANAVTTATSSEGVLIGATSTGMVAIIDDEPAVGVVTVTSRGEAMGGDQFFLVIAGTNSPAMGLDDKTLLGASTTGPYITIDAPIANVDEVLARMLGLDEVRSKAATHVMYGRLPDPLPRLMVDYSVTLSYSSATDIIVTTTLDVVTSRTNRSFYLDPGPNFTGLGLVPDDSSIATLLLQEVPNANPAFEATVKAANDRSVRLSDVVETVFAFEFDSDGGWITYSTDNPLTGVGPASGGLTDLAPHQGTIIETRRTVTPALSSAMDVFDKVTVPGVGEVAVPVRMDIDGPFLDLSGGFEPVTQELRVGFNLLAPHAWAPTPFDTVFGGSGGIDIGQLYSSAISLARDVAVFPLPPDTIIADIIERVVTESAAVGDHVPPGTIDPTLTYWIKVAETSPQVKPALTATSPSGP